MRNTIAFTVRLLALMGAFCAVGRVWALSEYVQGIWWTYTVVNGVASVSSGSNWMISAIPNTTTGHITIPSTLGGYKVKSIGSYAFYDCWGITSVTIPDSVTSIGAGAFSRCEGLTCITIPDSVTSIGSNAFSDCSGLTSVTIPDSVTIIGESAFYGCDNALYDTTTVFGVKLVDGWAIGNTGSISGSLDLTGVRGIGGNAFRDCSGLTSVMIPDNVTSIGPYAFYGCRGLTLMTIGNGVTSIGSDAFYQCTGLTSVTIPDSVTSIGSYAFYGCRGLTSVAIGNGAMSIGNYAFYQCTGLTSVTIPDSVTSIGDRAFYNCSGLTSITIGNGVTSIGPSAFSGCSGLTSLTIPDSVTSIGNHAFDDCSGLTSMTIGNGVTNIGNYAFSSCYGLTNITIGNSVINIGNYAFYGCRELTNVTVPDSVTSIGDCALAFCSGLTSVTIGNSVTNIGNSAFYSCSGLTSITMPDGVTSIADYAFQNCSGLTSLTIPDSVISIGESAFSGCSGLTSLTLPFVGSCRGNSGTSNSLFGYIFGTYSYGSSTATRQWYSGSYSTTYHIPSGLKSVVITDETKLGYGAFYNCSGLTSVTIPDSVTSVGSYAFSGCSGLTSVTIPDSVTGIGSSTFSRCSGLTSVTIPDSVTSIGSYAFSGCRGLTSVTIPDSVTSISADAFASCDMLNFILLPSTLPTEDLVVPSSATIIRYKITQEVYLDVADGTVTPSSISVKYGATYGYLPVPSRQGYSFDHWELDGTVIDGDTIVSSLDDHALVAQWTANQYTVTFDANDGEGGTNVTQDYATEIIPPTVIREGYTFTSWSPEVAATVPANDVTYTAQWKINQYKVTFDANGGAGGNIAMLDYGTTICEPTVAREGHTFKGWTPVLAATVPAEDVTYVAQWEVNNYTITFGSGHGSGVASHFDLPYATPLAAYAPAFARIGYTLSGWAPELGFVPASNATYVAEWTPNKYAITFDANGGKGGWREEREYGSEIVAPTVSRDDFTFMGWVPEVEATVPANSVTYTARWRRWRSVVDSADKPIKERHPDDYAYITDIVIGAEVEEIPAGFFDGCDALERLTFLSPETELGDNDLRTVGRLFENQPDGYWVVQGELLGYKGDCPGAIPNLDTIRYVADGALYGCTALTDLTFTVESVLTDIGTNAFFRCTELASLTLPPSLLEIGDEAFMGCSYIGNVIVPGSVRRVGDRAFKDCTGFTAAQIEYGVESLGEEAFFGDWKIREVDLPSTVTNIGINAFGGDSSMVRIGLRGDVIKAKEIFSHYEHIREATVKAGDGEIVDGLFEGFKSLQDVHFLGDCPVLADDGRNLYKGTPAKASDDPEFLNTVTNALVTYVEKNSTGWDGTPGSHELPQSWPRVGDYRRAIAWWDVPTYQVLFDSNGGTLGIQETYQYSEQFFALPPEPVQTGYSFAGWWTQPIGGLPVTKDTIFIEGVYTHLYAHWVKGHWVFLDPNGGTVANDFVTYVEQSVYGVLPVPVRSGYAFGGWIYNGYRIEPETEINEKADHTLVAQWEANLYSVRYNANGGEGEMLDQDFVYGVNQALRKNTFTYAGHEFAGWATNETGEAVYADCEAVSNLTVVADGWVELYAVWEESDFFDFTLGTVTLNDLDDMKPIRFSNAWSGHIGVSPEAEARVTLFKTALNETTTLTNAVGSGEIEWIPERADTYVLMHQVYENGIAVGNALELTIVVPGPEVAISPADGTTFDTSLTVTVAATEGAKIYYTLDGSEPTASSARYTKKFRINGKTTVKAIAVEDGRPWSETAVAHYALGTAANPVISPADGTVFGGRQEVSISWDSEDGEVRYTLDGSEPTKGSVLYEGPFEITGYCVVKAKVFSDTLFDSAVVMAEFVQNWTIGISLDCGSLEFETSGDEPWDRDGECMRSGRIGDNEESILSTTVPGAGTLSFKWRTSCEEDEYHEWDHLELRVDGAAVLWLDGESGWRNGEHVFDDGPHSVEWAYVKDDTEFDGEDCAWLDEVVWTPRETATFDVGEKGTVEENGSGGYVVTAKEGRTLTEDDIVFVVPEAKGAYKVEIAPGGGSATVSLNPPVVGIVPEEEAPKDEDDDTGLLVEVPEESIFAKPTPEVGETVGALPVKTYPGLWYQASWGDDLGSMTEGDKVQATGGTLYLGVIKQKGDKGFYKLSVSEK